MHGEIQGLVFRGGGYPVTSPELRAIIAAADTSKEKRRRTLSAYLVGKVLAATGGRADPKIAGEQVEKLL